MAITSARDASAPDGRPPSRAPAPGYRGDQFPQTSLCANRTARVVEILPFL